MRRMDTELLKADALGRIEIVDDGSGRRIRRDTRAAHAGLRWLARSAAAREARVLRALAGLDGVPQLISWHDGVLERSYMDGAPMQQAQPRDPSWYRRAHVLLKRVRARGVAHNDLAKEPNWLQRG